MMDCSDIQHEKIKKERLFQKPSRLLIKISGEYFQSSTASFDICKAQEIGSQIKTLVESGYQVALVLGGGNFFRGAAFSEKNSLSRETADRMGMMATVMNVLAFQSVLQEMDLKVSSYCAYDIAGVMPAFNAFQAKAQLDSGKVIICAGGLGIPCLTTDTAAVMRSIELSCDIILKGTKPTGIFSQDPFQFPDAVFYPRITYAQALKEKLEIMDQVAFCLAQEQKVSLIVFSLYLKDALLNVIEEKALFTLVTT